VRGLTSEEAGRRLAEHGPNVLPDTDGPRPLRELAAQFTHTFAVLLWVAAGLALLAGLPQLSVAVVVIIVLTPSSRSGGSTAPTGRPSDSRRCSRHA
jgi:magnesium-transporting ATPase (P-type)